MRVGGPIDAAFGGSYASSGGEGVVVARVQGGSGDGALGCPAHFGTKKKVGLDKFFPLRLGCLRSCRGRIARQDIGDGCAVLATGGQSCGSWTPAPCGDDGWPLALCILAGMGVVADSGCVRLAALVDGHL
ncbi:hypothetical protein GOP47_0004539 [Adiantum capillus-veneris]|uniref:Uncharacterized protein n=1 Tax=Adiantum capillus-veneris TaxID=13818 RepID=A0A9D4ZPS8_ADICA|nr:hypothetical protein GOP47_0004539 [Adiantum capillus-veneris]